MVYAIFSEQSLIFIYSFIFGIVLGAIYDIFRLIRKELKYKFWVEVICDILYMLIISVLTFIFILIYNKGIVRFYVLFGEFLGIVLYRFTIGIVSIRFLHKVVLFLRAIVKYIIMPFAFIEKLICKLCNRIKNVYLRTMKILLNKRQEKRKKKASKSIRKVNTNNNIVKNKRKKHNKSIKKKSKIPINSTTL